MQNKYDALFVVQYIYTYIRICRLLKTQLSSFYAPNFEEVDGVILLWGCPYVIL